jgi:hypothetical protein
MGCGSSKPVSGTGTGHARDAALAVALAEHLSVLLDVPLPPSADIQSYINALMNEGFNTPRHLDNLTVEELKEEPFNFKRGHLIQVCACACKCAGYVGGAMCVRGTCICKAGDRPVQQGRVFWCIESIRNLSSP